MTLSSHHIHYFISYAVAFVAFGLVAKWYLWPAIRHRAPEVALTPLLLYACLRGGLAIALPMVWLFNVVGLLDLVYANISTFKDQVDPVLLGVAYYLAALNVPAMVVVHVLIFFYLLRPASAR